MKRSLKTETRVRRGLPVVLLTGIVLIALLAAGATYSHLRRTTIIERSIIEEELPVLVDSLSAYTNAYFKNYSTGLTLLADVVDWPEVFAEAYRDPSEIQRLRETAKTILSSPDLSFIDMQRDMIYTFWSDTGVQLDKNKPRDSWYFDTYKTGIPPNRRLSVYYDDSFGHYVGYYDQVIWDDAGEAVGLIGVVVDLLGLAAQLQTQLTPGDSIVVFSENNPIIGISHESITPLGTVYDSSGVKSEETSSDIGSPISTQEMLDAGQVPKVSNDGRNIISNVDLPFPQLEVGIVMSMETRIAELQDVFRRQNILNAIVVLFLLSSYIGMASFFIHQSNKQIHSLQELRSKLDDLLSVMGHNILNGVHTLYGIIANEPIDRRSLRTTVHHIDTIVRNSVYAGRDRDLGKADISAPIVIADVIARLQDTYVPIATGKDQTLLVVSAGESATPINSDQELLYHMLLNLVDNAIKYTPHGGSVVAVFRTTTYRLECLVADQGPGFTGDDRKHLFTKFRRLSAKPTGKERSAGIGLYTTRRLGYLINARLDLLDDVPAWAQHWVPKKTGAIWLVTVPSRKEEEP